MMTIEEFARELEMEFEDIETNTLKPETKYRDIENWNSMYALIVIAFVDAHYDIILSAADLKDTSTIKDLYDLVNKKIE